MEFNNIEEKTGHHCNLAVELSRRFRLLQICKKELTEINHPAQINMTEQTNNMLWRKGADGKWIYTSELSPMENKSHPSNIVDSSSSHNSTSSIEMSTSLIKMIESLSQDIKKLKSSNTYLKKKVKTLDKDIDNLYYRIYKAEINHHSLHQYNRRENIVIAGIPEYIEQNELETKVIELLKSINVNISSYGIAACHRLKRQPNDRSANIIVRFVNRQDAYKALKNRKHLANSPFVEEFNGNIYIYENLCPEFRKILNYCESLQDEGLIKACYSLNGIVHIKMDDVSKAIKILHMNDVKYYFEHG